MTGVAFDETHKLDWCILKSIHKHVSLHNILHFTHIKLPLVPSFATVSSKLGLWPGIEQNAITWITYKHMSLHIQHFTHINLPTCSLICDNFLELGVWLGIIRNNTKTWTWWEFGIKQCCFKVLLLLHDQLYQLVYSTYAILLNGTVHTKFSPCLFVLFLI